MRYSTTLLLTLVAPILWGTTYIVTNLYLPPDYPVTVAMLRALPAGLLLLIAVRQLPIGKQWLEIFILGTLNFTIFWICLFIAAYALPGGIAATIGAVSPIMVMFVAYWLLDEPINKKHVAFAIIGFIGVALIVLKPTTQLNISGMIAALIGTVSMTLGSVLSKKWRANTPLLTFTAWQLTAGGILLLPLAFWLESPLPDLKIIHLGGLIWLGFFGGFLSYILWFHGIQKLPATQTSILILLSPATAILLGWLIKDESITNLQMVGIGFILFSIIGINYQRSST